MIENVDVDSFLWVEKYRPKTINEIIIPESIRTLFEKFIKDGEIPNLLLSSVTGGSGKTTSAKALCNELGASCLYINASLDNSIEDIRTKVVGYATTKSVFRSGTKVVLLDEADRLSQNALDTLKGLQESVHKNCRFILTCNTKSRIPEPLQSRCIDIDFTFSQDDKKKIQAQMFKRCSEILQLENVKFNPKVLAQIVQRYSPDNRSTIQALQRFANEFGEINEAALGHMSAGDTEVLLNAMKEKKYNDVKTWVFENSDRIDDTFYGKLFKSLEQKIEPQSVPEAVLVIGEYQKYHTIVPDMSLHYLAMLTQLMMNMRF